MYYTGLARRSIQHTGTAPTHDGLWCAGCAWPRPLNHKAFGAQGKQHRSQRLQSPQVLQTHQARRDTLCEIHMVASNCTSSSSSTSRRDTLCEMVAGNCTSSSSSSTSSLSNSSSQCSVQSSSSVHFQLRPACGLHEYTSQAALEHTHATITPCIHPMWNLDPPQQYTRAGSGCRKAPKLH